MQNELPESCPQWAWDEAYRLASQVVAERGTRMETFQPIVARALVAAERRGIERSAKECDRIAGNRADFNQDYRRCAGHCSFVIRQLGEEP